MRQGDLSLAALYAQITSAKRLSRGAAIPTLLLYSEIYRRVLSPITFEPFYLLSISGQKCLHIEFDPKFSAFNDQLLYV